MTDEALRRACEQAAKDIYGCFGSGNGDLYCQGDTLELILMNLIKQQRAAVWEEVAQEANRFTKGYDVGWLLRTTKQGLAKRILQDFGKWCEQRAKELRA